MNKLSASDMRYVVDRFSKEFSLSSPEAEVALEEANWNYERAARPYRKIKRESRSRERIEKEAEGFRREREVRWDLWYSTFIQPEIAKFCRQGEDFDALRNPQHFAILQSVLLDENFLIEWEPVYFMGEKTIHLKLFKRSGIPKVLVTGYTQEDTLVAAVYHALTQYVYDENTPGESENEYYQNGKRAVLNARKERGE